MALSPLEILGAAQRTQATPVTSFLGGQQAAGALQTQALQNQALEQKVAQADVMNPLLAEQARQSVAAGQAELDRAAFGQTLQTMNQAARLIKPFIEQGDLIGAASQIDRLESLGVDPEAIQEIDQLIAAGDLDSINQQIAAVENLNRANAGEGEIIKSSQRLVNIGDQLYSEVDVAQPDGTLETIRTPVGGEVARGTTGETASEERLNELLAKQKELQAEADIAATKAEQKALGDERAAIASDIRTGARDGAKAKREVTRIKAALSDLETGRFAQARQSLGGIVPGIRDASAETFNSLVNQFILSRKDELLGGGILSDADIALLKTVGPQLGNTLEANLNILDIFEQVADNSIERGVRFREFTKGGGNAEDFEFETQAEAQPQAQPQAQPAGIAEGATATNPQTGEKVVFRNGQWQSL